MVYEQVKIPNGLIIKMIIAKIAYQDSEKIQEAEIDVDLYMDGKFPFSPPKIILRTHYTTPSLADGRDVLGDVMQKQWTPSITVVDLIRLIPNFIRISANFDSAQLQQTGIFHLGMPMSYSLWQNYHMFRLFDTSELDPHDAKIQIPRRLVVTEASIVILEPSQTI